MTHRRNCHMIDRESESARLIRAADEAPQLVVMRGRRRVGKSYLLNHAFEDRRFAYFQADGGAPRPPCGQSSSSDRPHMMLLMNDLRKLLEAF